MERRCSASLGWNYSEVQFLYTHMYPEGDDIGGSMGHNEQVAELAVKGLDVEDRLAT